MASSADDPTFPAAHATNSIQPPPIQKRAWNHQLARASRFRGWSRAVLAWIAGLGRVSAICSRTPIRILLTY